MALLELKDVHTFYGNIQALKGISISVDEGEIVTLIGANGDRKNDDTHEYLRYHLPFAQELNFIRMDKRNIKSQP